MTEVNAKLGAEIKSAHESLSDQRNMSDKTAEGLRSKLKGALAAKMSKELIACRLKIKLMSLFERELLTII